MWYIVEYCGVCGICFLIFFGFGLCKKSFCVVIVVEIVEIFCMFVCMVVVIDLVWVEFFVGDLVKC